MSPAQARRIEYLPLADLAPNPSNPKAHDLSTLDSSVGRFGFIEPVVRDERTGRIISGHGRTETLASMSARGENPPEGVRVDAAGNWLVPVVVGWASRTDTEASAALITLNRTTELGGWVDDALLDLLDDLVASDSEHGLDGVGFDDASIVALRERLDTLAQQTFLDDLDTGEGHNPFNDSAGLEPGDEVEVRFVMTAAARTALMARLREHRRTAGLAAEATFSDVLLDLAGLTPALADAAV